MDQRKIPSTCLWLENHNCIAYLLAHWWPMLITGDALQFPTKCINGPQCLQLFPLKVMTFQCGTCAPCNTTVTLVCNETEHLTHSVTVHFSASCSL